MVSIIGHVQPNSFIFQETAVIVVVCTDMLVKETTFPYARNNPPVRQNIARRIELACCAHSSHYFMK
jgi:hypothetical protein